MRNPRIAEDPRARVWGQGSDLRPRIAIQVKSEWTRFGSNRCAIRLNCIRFAKTPESSRNRADCKSGGLDRGGIATTKRAPFGDCGAPRGLQRALRLTNSRWVRFDFGLHRNLPVFSGLRVDRSIMPGLHRSHCDRNHPATGSIAGGWPCFWKSHRNRDW